jgi:hypothetical protein
MEGIPWQIDTGREPEVCGLEAAEKRNERRLEMDLDIQKTKDMVLETYSSVGKFLLSMPKVPGSIPSTTKKMLN